MATGHNPTTTKSSANMWPTFHPSVHWNNHMPKGMHSHILTQLHLQCLCRKHFVVIRNQHTNIICINLHKNNQDNQHGPNNSNVKANKQTSLSTFCNIHRYSHTHTPALTHIHVYTCIGKEKCPFHLTCYAWMARASVWVHFAGRRNVNDMSSRAATENLR